MPARPGLVPVGLSAAAPAASHEISRLLWVERIFDIAALAGFTSVIARGLTDHPALKGWHATVRQNARTRT